MGLPEGIRGSKYDNNMARRGHNYMPCLRQADKVANVKFFTWDTVRNENWFLLGNEHAIVTQDIC